MMPGKPKSKTPLKETTPHIEKFRIVGIGASAGGLEALEKFLGNVPENSGMAYVVIQHLDPTKKGMLPELLQRISKIKVHQVKDLMAVKPNCIYVIPPNKSMSILKGVLHLFEPMEIRGLRLPVDFFLRSLADERMEQAIGLVLSGMGSDGSMGLRAIKEKNGIVVVQDPVSAKFDSMPRSAIDSVLVDIVAPAEELPAKLMSFLKYIPVVKSDKDIDVKDKSSLEKIIILLRANTGNDFSAYKNNSVYRRIERRMAVHKIDKIASYVHFLQKNPKEIDLLFKELMIGVTNFFRDTKVWEKLKESTIPNLIANLQDQRTLRAWIPACSTGEEAYSLGIVFKEALEKVNPPKNISLQIFATDLDNDAIEIARKGIFPSNIASDVSANRLSRFFSETEDGFRVNTEIREMLVFAPHNIIMHPPFTKIDILSCRNMLIYMDNELQKKLLKMFYYSSNPDGIMILGSSETLGDQGSFFDTVDTKLRIFKRSYTAPAPDFFDFPSSFSRGEPIQPGVQHPAEQTENIQSLVDQMLLQLFSPSGVLVNEKGDIIYISGRTGKYLEPPVGKANMNIFAMLRDGLRYEFPLAFRKAVLTKETVVIHNIKLGTNGGSETLNVNIQWINKPHALKGTILIVFIDIPDISYSQVPATSGKKALKSGRQSALEQELNQTREEMQNLMEEMQTSQEELKSTNEELQSANEELQSTNEELTTSKEEMQSLNEELQTVNAELLSKVEDYSQAENDMKNLLNSTDIATLFLDKELNIRRFTTQATKIFKLIKGDIGRPFTDQASDLIYPDLADDANEVLRTLAFVQKQIPAKDGRYFSVRIMPYRTFDDRIDGLVITFINTTDLKKVEENLNESKQINTLLFNSSPNAIIKLSTDWKIQEFSPKAEKLFALKREEAIDQNFIQMFIAENHQKKTKKELQKLVDEALDNKLKMNVFVADRKLTTIEWSVNILFNNLKIPNGMILIAEK